MCPKKTTGKKRNPNPKTEHLKAHQWKKGCPSPNPSGRPKDKPILETLREIIDAQPELALKIATNALKEAASNLGWFTEVRDMLDGKLEGSEGSGSKGSAAIDLRISFVDGEKQ